ncbi:selenium cofactor biosynthesis protein YqeC [Ruminococcus sp. 5_1_39BFAA]|uniref:selenium cofactor biosynthesis protein YqeC n=1 Tax=Ruminococcus sp. 5_1_39BFAA TaxID=457412 RepID=UPI0035667063
MRHPEYFLDLLELDIEKYPVIAVVGGGGKTSLIYRLNEELLSMGKRVIITTTTHMVYEPERPFARGGEEGEVKELLERYGYAAAAELDEEQGKITSLSQEKLLRLKELCDVMLIEADGSRQKPLKVPAEWEPVIPSFANVVISVVGLDCLGKPICETTHRMERTSEFLKKRMDAPVTEEDIVKIASSIHGLFKNVEGRVYRVYLNKSDTLKSREPAEKIVEELLEEGTVAAYGSLILP